LLQRTSAWPMAWRGRINGGRTRGGPVALVQAGGRAGARRRRRRV